METDKKLAYVPSEQLGSPTKEIQEVIITTDTLVKLVFKTTFFDKETYISTRLLVDILDENMKKLSDLPENKADTERYIQSLSPDEDRPSWF